MCRAVVPSLDWLSNGLPRGESRTVGVHALACSGTGWCDCNRLHTLVRDPNPFLNLNPALVQRLRLRLRVTPAFDHRFPLPGTGLSPDSNGVRNTNCFLQAQTKNLFCSLSLLQAGVSR